jgi:hypothetical protein
VAQSVNKKSRCSQVAQQAADVRMQWRHYGAATDEVDLIAAAVSNPVSGMLPEPRHQ